jgi:hypothetical protein
MIESSGHSWVIDIGLGGELDAADDARVDTSRDPARADEGMTRWIGTPAYMAPEQLGPLTGAADPTQPARHDARTDVWGLGATLYELLSLRLPFPGTSVKVVAQKILSSPPEPLNGSIPRELRAICLRALEKEPGDRYATSADLAADLHRWLEFRPTVAGEAAICRMWGRAFGAPWVRLRRLGFWSRRRPAAAFAIGLAISFLLLGTASALHVKQLNLDNANVRADRFRVEAQANKAQRDGPSASSISSSCPGSAARSGRWAGSGGAGSSSAPFAEARQPLIRSFRAWPPRPWRASMLA